MADLVIANEPRAEKCDDSRAEACAPSRPRRSPPSRVTQIARWLITIICLLILIWVVDLRAAARILLAAHGPSLLAAVGVAFLDRGMMISKWYPLLRVQATSISFGHAARSYFAAGLASLLIPTPISGDVLRAVALGRRQGTIPEIGASIVMERLLGMVGSGVLCLIALAVALGSTAHLQYLAHWIGALLAVIFLGVLLSFNRSLVTRVSGWTSARKQSAWLQNTRRFGTAYAVYRDRKAVLVLVGLLSVAEQFLPIFCVWILSHALGVSVTFEMLIVAIPLSIFVARLPIAMSGMGAAEGTLVYLLGLFGVPSHGALALALAATTMNIVVAVPGLLFWADAMHPIERDGGDLAVFPLPPARDVACRESPRS
jgi:uncharacterized protein (TIRG00374 family)